MGGISINMVARQHKHLNLKHGLHSMRRIWLKWLHRIAIFLRFFFVELWFAFNARIAKNGARIDVSVATFSPESAAPGAVAAVPLVLLLRRFGSAAQGAEAAAQLVLLRLGRLVERRGRSLMRLRRSKCSKTRPRELRKGFAVKRSGRIVMKK